MTSDRDTTRFISSWLHETTDALPRNETFFEHWLDELPATPQRRSGRRLRRLLGNRTVPAQAPTPITASNSYGSMASGRFQSMFSATKFVVAAAIVALFGGFLLAGIQPQPSEEMAPAATSAGPGTFSPTGSLAQPRAEHSATLLLDGRVLVVGGFDVRQQDSSTSTAEIWDPDTDTFSPTGSLAEPRISHTATLLPDGRVLVVGGWGDDDPEGRGPRITTAEVWDPSTGAFSPAGSTAMGGSAFVTLLPDGRFLVVMSDDFLASPDVWEDVAVAEVWDPATSTFSPADSLLVNDGTALADGRVLITSHEDPDGWAHPASAEVWDPGTDTFSPAGSSALGRIRSSTLLADGRVLFLGEHTLPLDVVLTSTSVFDMTSAEVWDPATSTFSPAGSFPGAPRGMYTVTALADGRALIVGGCTYGQICHEHFDSAEVWDPATETFGPAGSPAETRMRHTATALPDGRVLVVGGWEYLTEGTVRASAEVWEPGPSSVEGQDQDADIVPMAPALTSGSMTIADDEPESWEETVQDGVQREQWEDVATVEMSDPRLTGMLTLEYTKQRFDHNDTDLAWGIVRLETDAGDWEGKMVQTSDHAAGGHEVAYYELVGSGAYEGLSAIVFETAFPTLAREGSEREWSAIVFPGDLPPDR